METKMSLLMDGYGVVDEEEDHFVMSKKVRVIPWPVCLGLGLVFLPLVLLVFWKKDDVKVVRKVKS